MTTTPTRPGGEVAVYEAPDGEVRLEFRLDQETVWLTQRQMAAVFRTSLDNISLHLKNVLADGELGRAATTEDFSVVRSEGRRILRQWGRAVRAPGRYCPIFPPKAGTFSYALVRRREVTPILFI